MASITLGGPDLRTVYLGSLMGAAIPSFPSPVPGLPLANWRNGGRGMSFAERRVTVGGFEIRAAEGGEGDPIVYLHGGAGLHIDRALDLLARQRLFGGETRATRRPAGRRLECGQAGLFLPFRTLPTVGLGGFLLHGGWGWNSRAVGPPA